MSMRNDLPILIDLDETVVSMQPVWFRRYREITGETVTLEKWKDFDVRKNVKRPEILDELLLEEHFFANLDPIPGAIEAIKGLIADKYDIVFLTQAPRDADFACRDKKRWIKKHFPKFDLSNIVFAHRKMFYAGCCLFDDNPKHLTTWKKQNPKGATFSIEYPYNKGLSDLSFPIDLAWDLFAKKIRQLF